MEHGAGAGAGAAAGGWGDASWPGITADLKPPPPPSAATWNTPTDLTSAMMTGKKVRNS